MNDAELNKFNQGLQAVTDAFFERCGAMNVRLLAGGTRACARAQPALAPAAAQAFATACNTWPAPLLLPPPPAVPLPPPPPPPPPFLRSA